MSRALTTCLMTIIMKMFFNSPMHYLANPDCSWQVDYLKAIDITLVIARDALFLDNHYLSSILAGEERINHRF